MDNTKINELNNEELIKVYLEVQEFINFLEKEKNNVESEEENAWRIK